MEIFPPCWFMNHQRITYSTNSNGCDRHWIARNAKSPLFSDCICRAKAMKISCYMPPQVWVELLLKGLVTESGSPVRTHYRNIRFIRFHWAYYRLPGPGCLKLNTLLVPLA